MTESSEGEKEASKPFLPSFPTVDSYSQASLRRILMATKASNSLPGDKRADWDYYSTFPGFRSVMEAHQTTLQGMLRSQLEHNGIKGRLPTHTAELLDKLSDANDTLLERIHINLDEAAGIKRTADPLLLEVSQRHVNKISGSWNNFSRGSNNADKGQNQNATSNSPAVKLLAAKNVGRPQMKFSHLVDNSSNPFVPRLTEKPHSLKPLSILVEYEEDGEEVYSHPYLYEIDRLQPSKEELASTPSQLPPSVEEAELVMVETVEQLRIAVAELAMEKVIGLDVEHHSYRSYLGLTCLVQISTEKKDFLIDPLNIWAEMTILNEVTANPKIVKVLHGCDSDVEWLQRDFSVYLVNVFDTHQAGKLLEFPRLSLAWLLQNYCNLSGDKQFQLADWRIRPLPEAMQQYARQDTRHLPYIYSRLKSELIEKGNGSPHLLQAAIHQSNDITKKRFHKPVVREDSHMGLVRKAKANLNSRQMWAARELYKWRDRVGREEDESPAFVLPNHMLLKIATEVPREMQGILACCNPVPPLVKQNLGLLHTIILNARERQVVTVETGGGRDGVDQVVEVPDVLENPLASPLDLAHLADPGKLDTILGSKKPNGMPSSGSLVKKNPDLRVFKEEKRKRNRKPLVFVSPFKRLVLLKPFLTSLQKEENKTEEKEQGEGLCTVKEVRSEMEDIRLENIKKVFDQLTSNTPKRVEKKQIEEEEEEEDMEEGEVDEDSDSDEEGDGDEEPYFKEDQPYREATEKLKGLRAGAQQKERGGGGGRGVRGFRGGRGQRGGRGGARGKSQEERSGEAHKRPGSELEHDKVKEVKVVKKEEFSYDSVDFNKFGKKTEVEEGDGKRRKGQEKSGGGRQKQRFMKRGSKSSTFKR